MLTAATSQTVEKIADAKEGCERKWGNLHDVQINDDLEPSPSLEKQVNEKEGSSVEPLSPSVEISDLSSSPKPFSDN